MFTLCVLGVTVTLENEKKTPQKQQNSRLVTL